MPQTANRADESTETTSWVGDESVTTATDPVLIVLDPDEPATSIRRAVESETFRDRTYCVMLVYPTAEYLERVEARRKAGITFDYSEDQLREDARREAGRIAGDWIDAPEAEVVAIGDVGRVRDRVVRLDAAVDFSRIYVPERDTSPLDRLFERVSGSTSLENEVAANVIVAR